MDKVTLILSHLKFSALYGIHHFVYPVVPHEQCVCVEMVTCLVLIVHTSIIPMGEGQHIIISSHTAHLTDVVVNYWFAVIIYLQAKGTALGLQ